MTTKRSSDDRGATGRGRSFVLLDDSLGLEGRCWLFEAPLEVISCRDPAALPQALEAVAAAGRRGLYAAGFLSYELGYLLEPKLAPLLPPLQPGERSEPLLWFGLFDAPRLFSPAEAGRWLAAQDGGEYRISDRSWSLTPEAYLAAARAVKDYIAAGDVYQINLTFKCRFDFAGDPLSLYADLRRRQRVGHGALVATPEFHLLSLSPELFLRVRGGRAEARPMKGTAPRGASPAADRALGDWLRSDAKSRAENLMIVDLLRNDLGRVAEIGSVEVTDLFTVERYPTLHQMTSGIRARLRPGVGLVELTQGLFPCGSVTGAPKVRAMEIIRELEAEPRGAYTGAIGMVAPDGEVAFNVAIRTLRLDDQGRGVMGLGSGIVQDSDLEAEWQECLLKARFLTDPPEDFQLIETLRWQPGAGYTRLERHLARLAASAAYFGYPCDPAALRDRLDAAAAGFAGEAAVRVRLLLDADGEIAIEWRPFAVPEPGRALDFVIATARTRSGDRFLYHKTTRRDLYESELARLTAARGCAEVVFLNERGELTEGSYTNLFVEADGVLLTPPVECGLLDGTLRRELIENGERPVEERVLTPDDLARAERIFLGNSLRGLLPARWLADDPREAPA